MPVLPRHSQLGRMTCCYYTNGACDDDELEMVAEPGVAPGFADFQSAALTDSAIQRESGPSARFRAVVFRLSGGSSAIELQRE